MSLHSVSWRVNVSALDQTELIQDSLKWIAGEKSSIKISKDKSFHGAEQYTIVAKNMNKISYLAYLYYSHSIVPGGFEVTS